MSRFFRRWAWLGLWLAWPAAALAFSTQGLWSVGLEGGGIQFPDVTAVALMGGSDTGYMWEFHGAYGVWKYLQLGVGFEYLDIRSTFDGTMEAYEGGPAPMRTVPFHAELRIPTECLNFEARGQVPVLERFNLVPSVSLGLAGAHYSSTDYLDGVKYTSDDNTTYYGWNFKLAVGAEYWLTDLMSVEAEAGRRYLRVSTTAGDNGGTRGELGGLFATAGMRFTF